MQDYAGAIQGFSKAIDMDSKTLRAIGYVAVQGAS